MKRSKPINSSNAAKPSRRKRQTAGELRALQRLMAQAVMRPLTPAQRMRPRWTDGRPAKKVAATFIKPNDRLTSFERLEIYNRQYWFRVIECFYDDFPGIRAVLGENRFRDLALAYLVKNPSTHFTLRELSRHLIDFLRAEPRWTAPRTELAIALAQIEWAHIEAFDNEAKTPASLDELQGREAAQIHLRLQPHITLLELAWPLDDYLIALRENSRLRGEASNAVEDLPARVAVRSPGLPQRRAVRLAVHRYRNVVYYKRLQARQIQLLQAFQKGASLQRALQAIPNAPAASIQAWFKNWSALGWFWTAK